MKDRASVVIAAHAALNTCAQMKADGVVEKQFPEIVRGYWRDVLQKVGVKPASPPYPPQWCGAFALACVHAAELGSALVWRFETATDKRSGFLYALHQTLIPEPGDIAYLAEPFQHHAVVCHVSADDIVGTVNGNQGAAEPIKYATHPLAHWTAFYSIHTLLPPENIA